MVLRLTNRVLLRERVTTDVALAPAAFGVATALSTSPKQPAFALFDVVYHACKNT